MISVVVVPNFLQSVAYKDLSAAADRVLAVLRDAQSRSLAAENQKVWGVKFDGNNKNFIMSTYVTGLFEAPVAFISLKNNLEFRNPNDPTAPMGGTQQVVFNSLTGEPTPKNTVTISIGLTNEPSNYKTITVYANGSIEIQ